MHGLIMLEVWFSLHYIVINYCLIMLYKDIFGEMLRKGGKGLEKGKLFYHGKLILE